MSGALPALSAMQRQIAKHQTSQVVQRRPPRTIVVNPDEWSYDWQKRPSSPVVFGLRTPSAQDIDRAESVAREAEEKDGEQAGGEVLKAFAVARGLCDPNDVLKPHPSLQMAEDEVPLAFTRATIERILGEIAKLMVETGPLYREATDDEIKELAQILSVDEPFLGMNQTNQALARRYLHFALCRLTE